MGGGGRRVVVEEIEEWWWKCRYDHVKKTTMMVGRTKGACSTKRERDCEENRQCERVELLVQRH